MTLKLNFKKNLRKLQVNEKRLQVTREIKVQNRFYDSLAYSEPIKLEKWKKKKLMGPKSLSNL